MFPSKTGVAKSAIIRPTPNVPVRNDIGEAISSLNTHVGGSKQQILTQEPLPIGTRSSAQDNASIAFGLRLFEKFAQASLFIQQSMRRAVLATPEALLNPTKE